MSFEIENDGVIRTGGRWVGHVDKGGIYAGGQPAPPGSLSGGQGGRMVGYIDKGGIYAGGQPAPPGSPSGGQGGRMVAPVTTPHPEWHAAAYLLFP